MAMDLNKAFEVDALLIGDVVGIIAGADDPSVAAQFAPIGSFYIRTNGSMYQKTGALDIDWTENISTATGVDFGDLGPIENLTAISHDAGAKVFILADTTLNDIEITLPLASTYTNKFFHIT